MISPLYPLHMMALAFNIRIIRAGLLHPNLHVHGHALSPHSGKHLMQQCSNMAKKITLSATSHLPVTMRCLPDGGAGGEAPS